MNTDNTNGFKSSFKAPRALLSIWKSTSEKAATQGVVFNRDRATGHKEILTKFIDGANLTYKGHKLPADLMSDNNVSLRIDEDNWEMFQDFAMDCSERLLHLEVEVSNVSIKKLTVKGEEILAITFFGQIVEIEPQTASLVGDDFTQEDLFSALKVAQVKNRERAAGARERLMNQAAKDGAPASTEAVGIS